MWRDWEETNLAAMGEYINGYAFKPSDWGVRGMPIIRIAQITGTSDFDNFYNSPLPEKYRISNGDIIFSWSGTLSVVQWDKRDGWLNQHLFKVLPRSKFHKRFFFHALKNSVEEMTKRAHGSTMHHIKRGELVDYTLEIPTDPDEQKAIAEVLDTVDEAIAATQAMLEKQDKIKDGLLQDLLTRGVDANGKLRPPYVDAPDLYKPSPLGFIPKEWDARTINDLAIHVSSGITPRGGSNVYQKSGVTFIRSQNVYNDGLKLEDVAYISDQIHSEMASSEIFANDVLLNITGASIGRCCPVPEGLGLANVNQHVCAIRLPDTTKDDAKFLSMILSSFVGQNQIARFNAGSNREGLNYQQIRSFDVPWPDSEERKIMSATYQSYQDQKQISLNELTKLKKLKAGLMQDLLTGKKRISNTRRKAA
ncbi:MAG: restriction endonuclease subunit S [Rickettsiales bacterium]